MTSNNSFNRSANSVDFMRGTLLVIMARRARLIQALGASIFTKQLMGSGVESHESTAEGRLQGR